MLTIFIVSAAAFVVSIATTRALVSPRSPFVVLDHPNDRSLHDVPTPRTGGLGLLAGIVAGVGAMIVSAGVPPREMLWTMGAALGVATVSFGDDLWTLSPLVRFVLQTASAFALVGAGGVVLSVVPIPFTGALSLGVASIPVTILFVVWMANLYNFMDGMDGLAGGMAVAGFGFLGAIALAAGEWWIGGMSAAIAASAAGFSVFNLPPARIFMGDVGSVPLGLLAGALAVRINQTHAADIWAALLIFSPFFVDATIVVLRRLGRREKVWEAHRTHWYQRLTLAGWSRRRALWFEYALMTAAGLSALVYVRADDGVRLSLAGAWMLVYLSFDRTVAAVERRSRIETSHSVSNAATIRQHT